MLPYEVINRLVYLTGINGEVLASGFIGIVFLIIMVNTILFERD